MSKPILELKNVKTVVNKGTANETTILKGINLKINEGDFITIVGTNGAGKSTLFNVIGGNLHADSGQILHNGKDITRSTTNVLSCPRLSGSKAWNSSPDDRC